MRRLPVTILRQPTEDTCGPTSLHAILNFFGHKLPIQTIIDAVPSLHLGGTLGVYLANYALEENFDVKIYSYNLKMFDPSWKNLSKEKLTNKLLAQASVKQKDRLQRATKAYCRFLSLGGKILWEDLSATLLESYLDKGTPLLVGLSATYLYQTAREQTNQQTGEVVGDDLRGYPAGHFVVICGYSESSFFLADPYTPTPIAKSNYYSVSKPRLIAAILLGILSYDGNVIVVKPKDQ